MNSIDTNGKGKLRARVTTAGITMPLTGAKVTVSRFAEDGKGEDILYTAYTDENGLTDFFILDAPPSGNSESPESTGPAYASYNMTVTKDGYYTVKNIGIPIFEGVSSAQPVVMLPLSAGIGDVDGNTIYYYENNGYENLESDHTEKRG